MVRRRKAIRTRRACTFFIFYATISMLAGSLRNSGLRHTSRQLTILQVLGSSANAFVIPAVPTSFLGCQRTLAVQRWKPDLLRGASRQRQRQEQKEIVQAATSRGPRLVRRGTHLNSRRRRRDDNVLYRADRVLANRTGRSRKHCFQLLRERRVFRVLGRDEGKFESSLLLEVVPGPKSKIAFSTPLRIDRKHDVPLPPPLLAVYHKPKWVLSVRRDPCGRPCLDRLFNGEYPWFTQTVQRKEKDDDNNTLTVVEKTKELLHPVGRLDYDTTGLLLFSSSGPLTQTLLHPKHAIEKEYVATVTGAVDEEKLRETLKAGVRTGAGVHKAKLLSAVPFESAQVKPYLEAIRAELPPEYNQTDLQIRGYLDVLEATELTTVTLTVREGKHRMVRRILANAGHPVASLHRQRLGAIELGDVPVGGIRELTEDETKWARRVLYLESKAKRKAFLKEVEADRERAAAEERGGDSDEKDDEDEDEDEDHDFVEGDYNTKVEQPVLGGKIDDNMQEVEQGEIDDAMQEVKRSVLGGEIDHDMQKFILGEIDEEEYERRYFELQKKENEQALKGAMRAASSEIAGKEAERAASEKEDDTVIEKLVMGEIDIRTPSEQ